MEGARFIRCPCPVAAGAVQWVVRCVLWLPVMAPACVSVCLSFPPHSALSHSQTCLLLPQGSQLFVCQASDFQGSMCSQSELLVCVLDMSVLWFPVFGTTLQL